MRFVLLFPRLCSPLRFRVRGGLFDPPLRRRGLRPPPGRGYLNYQQVGETPGVALTGAAVVWCAGQEAACYRWQRAVSVAAAAVWPSPAGRRIVTESCHNGGGSAAGLGQTVRPPPLCCLWRRLNWLHGRAAISEVPAGGAAPADGAGLCRALCSHDSHGRYGHWRVAHTGKCLSPDTQCAWKRTSWLLGLVSLSP